MTDLADRQKLSYIAAQAADARLNVELETEGMTLNICLLYTSPSPRDRTRSRMPSSA